MGQFDFDDKEIRPWPNHRFGRATIIGHTTSKVATIWFRAKDPGDYYVFASTERIDAIGEPSLEGDVLTVTHDGQSKTYSGKASPCKKVRRTTDLTCRVELGGLEEDTEYHYVVFSAEERDRSAPRNWWEIGVDPPRSFRTMAPRAKRAAFGLVSCHKPYDRKLGVVKMHLWRHFREQLIDSGARFVLCAGDQVYTDGHKKLNIWKKLKHVKDEDGFPQDAAAQLELMKGWYRDIYRGYWGFKEIQEIFSRFPTYMTWDDHEIMDGWGSYKQKEIDGLLDKWNVVDTKKKVPGKRKLIARMFEAAKQVYEEYEHSHNPETDDGVYDYSFIQGPAAFYVLDVRGNRDFTKPGHPVLGEDQHQRFQDWLSKRRQKVLFIVSAVPMVHASSFVVNKLDIPWLGIADDLRDEWEHESHWDERDRILDAVFAHSQANGTKVVFLSGDVHIGAAFRLYRGELDNAQVYQFTSSAITWSSAPGELLKLIVRDSGELAAKPGASNVTKYEKLHIAEENNYGIVDVRAGSRGEEAQVRWTLYEDAHEEERVSKLTTITV